MIRESLNLYARGLPSKFDAEQRRKTVGASEIGACERKTFWAKHPDAPEDRDYAQRWGAAMRGTFMENKFWQPALKRRFGRKLLLSGRNQVTIKKDYLSATIDGLLINQKRDCLTHLGILDIESDCILVECKTLDPRVNLREAKSENEYQVQTQLGLIRELTEYKPMYALISYMDASFWDEVAEYPIRFNQSTFEAAGKRAARIITANDAESMRPEGWIAGGSECEYCPYAKACGVTRRSFVEKQAVMDNTFMSALKAAAYAYRANKEQIKSSDAEAKGHQEEIKKLLKEKGIRKVDGVVTWSPVKGKESIDIKRLKEDAAKLGLNIDDYSTVGEPTDSLLVTIK